MWLDPTERPTIADTDEHVWLSIKEEEGFVLQQYQPHIDVKREFVPVHPFRIILRAMHLNLLIAHDNRFSVVIDHWEWLENNVFKQFKLLDDLPEDELFQFAILKITSLVKSSETFDPSPFDRLASPEQFFTQLYPNVSLIAYYPCSLWEDILYRGILFISTKHCFFYSESEKKSVVIPLVEISLVQQILSGMVPNSLQVSTIDKEKFLFSKLDNLEEVYDVLNGLWEFSIFTVLRKLEEDMQELNWELDEEEGYEEPVRLQEPSEHSSYVNRFGFTEENISTETLIAHTRNTRFQKLFRLPNTELLLDSQPCTLEGWGPGYVKDINGTIYVSNNFICFYSILDKISAVIGSMTLNSLESRIPDKIIITTSETATTFKFSGIPPSSSVGLLLVKLWNESWRQHVLMDVSQVRESIATQAKAKREKQSFFRDSVGDLTKLQRQEWKKYVKVNGLGLTAIKTPLLEKLVREGIPRRARGETWQFLSGSRYKEHLWQLEYRNICRECVDVTTLATEEIGRDINRTFPEHPFFQTERGRNVLKRVLTAYSFRNPSIGYCQSMNIVCAFQMLFMSEEKAYWMVSSVCEDILPDYYAPSMIGSTTDQAVFEYLLKERMPDLYSHFISLSIPITLITIPWLLCTFVGFLKWQVTLRVLDCFFYSGRQVLFQVGLSIFKIYHSSILECDDGVDVIEILKNSDVECDELFKVAFGDFADLQEDYIDQLHKELRSQVVRDLTIKLEKRKQTAALQLSKKYYKARRTSSTEPLTTFGNSDNSNSALVIHGKSPKSLLRAQRSVTALGNLSKFAHNQLSKGAGAVFRFRSSRRAPIILSPTFKPEDSKDDGEYSKE